MATRAPLSVVRLPRVRRALVGVLLAVGVLATPAATAAQLGEGLAGWVIDDRLFSPTVSQVLPYRVYLPPDYYTTLRSYPVLYMLHGAGGNYTEWSDQLLPEQVDAMIKRGAVQPMIVVMPDGGERTYWANWAEGGPQWEDYVVEDLVPEIDRRYRTIAAPESRGIGGHSMGGLGALNLAMRHPQLFGIVGAHSPSVRVDPDPDLWFLPGQRFFEYDPVWLVYNRWGPERLTIWVDVGDVDWWRSNVEKLHAALQSERIPHSWHVYPGDHEADYWIAHVPDYLAFYSSALRGEASEPALTAATTAP